MHLSIKNDMIKSKIIAVNAYPLRVSGGLMILRQFIHEIESRKDNLLYIIFVHRDIEIASTAENIKFEYVYFNRLLTVVSFWQLYGMKRWLQRNNCHPDAVISLTSTNVRYDEAILSINYFHQAIPLYSEYKWSFWRKSERVLWFYKYIYKYLVAISLQPNTFTIVQLDCVKNRFENVFKRSSDKVLVVSPKLTTAIIDYNFNVFIDKQMVNCIYAATNFKYKNHIILFESFRTLKNQELSNFHLYLTGDSSDYNDIEDLSEMITFIGHMPYSQLLGLYSKMDVLLFPSYIESFGLPLLEASSFGLKIIAADTDFSREVLKNYSNKCFANYNSSEEWSQSILEISNNNIIEGQIIQQSTNSWNYFFDFLNSKLINNV